MKNFDWNYEANPEWIPKIHWCCKAKQCFTFSIEFRPTDIGAALWLAALDIWRESEPSGSDIDLGIFRGGWTNSLRYADDKPFESKIRRHKKK